MSPLGRLIRRQIDASGPISIAQYMALCLTHPEHGYYVTRNPLGTSGDFITAPEVSQMFGEMCGLCLAQAWVDDGRPDAFVLAEPGPGRGTLMADILRVLAGVPGMVESARVALVEASPVLRQAQAERLAGLTAEVEWVDRVEELPEGVPLYLVANEFFDALPVHQFQRSGAGWRPRQIGTAEGGLQIGLGAEGADALLEARFGNVPEGTVVETCPAGEAAAEAIGARISANGGAALIVDYGDWDGTGDTLQAVRRHATADPLSDPGAADLTAHVGFRWLAEASGLSAQFTRQGEFLERLGITDRANRLAAVPGRHDAIAADHRRLTHPDEMGSLFKVLGLRPKGAPPLTGFA